MSRKMTTKMSQFRCDTNVLTDYLSDIGSPCNEDSIQSTIERFLEEQSDKIYIGVTHHPCQRFTGNKSNTTPLPSSLNYTYKFEEAELLTERAHYLDYSKMYLICYTHEKQEIFDNEKIAIRIAKELNVARVLNKTEGGNGHVTDSEIYWLYICVKDESL